MNKKVYKIKDYLISFTVLGLFLVCILLLFKYLLMPLIYKLINLLKMVKELDAVVIVALIAAIVSIVTTFGKAIYDSIVNKNNYLSKKREKTYEDFIEMIFGNINSLDKGSVSDDIIKAIQKFNKVIMLWGSPRVIRSWLKFKREGNITENYHGLYVLEEVINAMRIDLGTSKIKKGEILNLIIKEDIKK